MNVKELKKILEGLQDDMEIVFGDKNPFEGWKLMQYKTLKTAKLITAARSISGNYYPENNNHTFETKPVKVMEMIYD